ncbi:MAG TPA: ribosomal protein S18-alanine N-acetyltransferase [Kofleriaceae bacterium]|nr:ribosomal protein S18-alanine N-acetyltransferase [Kofleriaceae bacterium]
MTAGLTIEPATAADLDAIDAVSRASFAAPWTRQAYADELARAHARVDVARAGAPPELAGYVVTWAVVDEVHLLVIATAPAHRRRGVADALLATVCGRADRDGARLTTLEVRAGNVAARALYERHGFTVVATRRAYYADDQEDAVVMIRERPAPA